MTEPAPKAIQTTLDDLITSAFPANICSVISTRFEMLDLGLTVLNRMPSNDDPNYTIGIVPVTKQPDVSSTEMLGRNSSTGGATIIEYFIAVYAFVKDSDRTRGMMAHAVLGEIVEQILADDPGLKAALAMLEATVLGVRKRMGRHYIRQTRYLSNEIDANHLFMSATEVIFEVEKVH